MKLIKFLLKLFRKKERKTTPNVFYNGALPDEEDTRDYVASIGETEDIQSVILDEYCPEIKQQGTAQSCTAFSVVSLYETEMKINGLDVVEGSEQYNYYISRGLSGLFPQDDGSFLREACKVLKNFGNCPEKLMPYKDNDINYEPGIFTHSFAKFFKISEYQRIWSVPGIKDSLKEKHPVALAVPITRKWMNLYEKTIPYSLDDSYIGGHAILITGIDETRKAFRVHNSWGKNWSDKGYSWLPYDYVYQVPWFNAWRIVLKVM